MNANLILVKARISLKKTDEGGRISGIASGYRPNHVFEMPADISNWKIYPGEIQFQDQELIKPGETKIVTVRFLKVPPVEKYMNVGQKWFINEGPRTIGEGEILEINE
jgi:translation elongation factor EF-Tu-like GTPase